MNVDNVFRFVRAGIGEASISLFWSLTSKVISMKKEVTVWSVLERALMAFTERCLFNVQRMEQWLSMVAFLVRMC